MMEAMIPAPPVVPLAVEIEAKNSRRTDDRPTITLRLRAEPNNAEPMLGLRRLLKHALRFCGWRCVEMNGTNADAPENLTP